MRTVSNEFSAQSVSTGISVLGIVTTLLVWYFVSDVFGLLPESTLPSPVTIAEVFLEFHGLIISNLWPTLSEAAVGFTIAAMTGVATAVVLTIDERIRNGLLPLIVSGNSVPRIAVAPLVIFYLGGFQAKYMIAAWVAYFPILINSMEGLGDLTEDLTNLLNSVDATTWQEYRLVRFPRALPFIFDGLKVAVPLSVVGAIVGEYIAADRGLGALALFAIQDYNMPLVFAIVATMGLVSVVAFVTVFLVEDRIVHWRETNVFME